MKTQRPPNTHNKQNQKSTMKYEPSDYTNTSLKHVNTLAKQGKVLTARPWILTLGRYFSARLNTMRSQVY